MKTKNNNNNKKTPSFLWVILEWMLPFETINNNAFEQNEAKSVV